MAVFPADVVAEILSRLPVKPLLRFRSVSKIWCSLIDSDHFIKFHLHRSIETKDHRKIILPECGFNSVSLDSLDDVAEELDLPLVIGRSPPLAVCCCNGLLLLWNFGDVSAIWNPSTRKSQKIPRPDLNLRPLNSFNVGFGYDAVSDDYKVLCLTQLNVQVYSLHSNSWRTIKDFPYVIRRFADGVFAHGALHWFLVKDVDKEPHSRGSIVAFNLATDETRLLSLPEVGVDDAYMDLVALEGCLCIVASVLNQEYLGVWVMKDYGVGESWNKLLSASHLSAMGSFHYPVFPLAYSKNGREVLLRDNEQFIWFGLEHNAVRKINVQGLPSYIEAKVLVQSLVPLCSGGETNPEEQHTRDKKIGMKRTWPELVMVGLLKTRKKVDVADIHLLGDGEGETDNVFSFSEVGRGGSSNSSCCNYTLV